MRTSNGFDRMSTEEELHQVLAVLGALERNGWMLTVGDSEADDLCADAVLEDSTDAESLAEFLEKRPELKN